ncbi:D-alanyl-D-alanine carboxypeptidase family protein [Mobilicoccus pelagius]|uniref:D-alanyl-D-alanine carboxypeptidase n=1 Tax=Mobilicoccus pelagius NBRC 104925 TaxID=1089455 RepID=H5UU16_9MICO|nr:serine hydrolase [Mobilicoccus pelagius]GAB49224.1 D-alanyl-D-alanine carboxypeptidase [Mobilicoccus pelagius NBRC 104925]
MEPRRVACTTLVLAAVCTQATAAEAVPTPTPTPPATSATTPATTPTATPPTPSPTSTIGGAGLLRPGVLHSLPAGVAKPPELQAGAYLVADLDDSRVVLAKNAHVQSRPASTLKTLTALTVAPKLAPTQIVLGTPEDTAKDGTKVGILPGEEYTVKQLLEGLLLTSGNDAAEALARANGGVPTTAREMTERAHALGALDTYAKNPSGLDATGQLTSAYDLALLGRAAVNDPIVAPYLTTKTATFPGARTKGKGSKRATFQIGSHNRLLWNYDGMIGVKNGFTKAAGQTYIGAARRGDQAYVVTYLAGTGVDWRDTAAVLDWAFANGRKARPVGQLVDAASFDAFRTAPSSPVESAATKGPEAPASTVGAMDLSPGSGRGRLALLGAGAAALVIGGALASLRVRRMRRRGRRG